MKWIAVIAARDRFDIRNGHGSFIIAGMPESRWVKARKAELHLHLEGSVDAETMQLLAPELSLDEIRERYRFDGFPGFLGCFKWIVERLRTPDDYALITRRLLDRLRAGNVQYAEITLSAGVVVWKKQAFGPIYDAVRQAASGAGVEVQWNLDGIRHFGVEHVRQVAELAADRVNDGVVSFGIGGDEERGPAEWFADAYRFASAKGLHLTAHAGETMGPESVWNALRLGADRIGHGIRSVEDPALLRHLRDRDIPLEICISSNVATRAVASLEEHPVRRIYEAGVPVVLNTDDPGIFNTTLSAEYELAARAFGFSEAELMSIAENGFRYAFV